jgi:hypothetical protein
MGESVDTRACPRFLFLAALTTIARTDAANAKGKKREKKISIDETALEHCAERPISHVAVEAPKAASTGNWGGGRDDPIWLSRPIPSISSLYILWRF